MACVLHKAMCLALLLALLSFPLMSYLGPCYKLNSKLHIIATIKPSFCSPPVTALHIYEERGEGCRDMFLYDFHPPAPPTGVSIL